MIYNHTKIRYSSNTWVDVFNNTNIGGKVKKLKYHDLYTDNFNSWQQNKCHEKTIKISLVEY